MIIRRSTARVRPGLLDEFRAFIEAGTPEFATLDGFLSDEIVVGREPRSRDMLISDDVTGGTQAVEPQAVEPRTGAAGAADAGGVDAGADAGTVDAAADAGTVETLTYVSRWRDAAAVAAFAGPGWRTEPVMFPDEDRYLLEPLAVRHVELRPAVPEDAPAIADVWHAAWGDGHRGLVPAALEAARTRDSFGPRAAARVPGTTVAVVNDSVNAVVDAVVDAVADAVVDAVAGDADTRAQARVVGFVTVRGEEVEQLFVAATHRGSGIAADLLSAGEDRIAAAGYDEAWLAVVAGNTRARRFYERAGWFDGGPLDYQAETPEGPVPVSTRRYLRRLTTGSSFSPFEGRAGR